jgi:hypothetical protein
MSESWNKGRKEGGWASGNSISKRRIRSKKKRDSYDSLSNLNYCVFFML